MGNRLSYPSVDLSGRVAVVTGGNGGIGYETAKALAVMGAHTIIACRSRERAEEAIERMRREIGSESGGREVRLEFMHLDLASLSSAKQFAVSFLEKNLPLHILINNAGIAWVPLEKSEDGYELHLQVNHLSHFLLTLELLPVLQSTARETGDVRVVCVSSVVHGWTDWDPDNMNAERDYSRYKFYFKSKLYNVCCVYCTCSDYIQYTL
jgi:NAD(P)-dependent dehydrogenase (short-subunit alcohol dehydrogenase family)